MADAQNLVGQGFNVVFDELYRALFGDAVGNLRQGEEVSAGDIGNTALTVGLNSLPGQLGRASGVTPEGLRGLAQLRSMVRRSNQPAGEVIPQSARGTLGNQAYGPGTYFSNRPAMRDRWYEAGPYVQGLSVSPRGALQIARGRGFMDEGALASRAAPENINALGVNSPAVKGAMDEGFIGSTSGAGRTTARRGLNDEVQTVFDPASIPGARFRDIGKIDRTTGMWENPTPAQSMENFVRGAAGRVASEPTSASMRTMDMVDLARANALRNVLGRFGSKGGSGPTPPPS